MNLLKIALLQIAPTGTLRGNLEKGTEACRAAKRLGADVALFPEMWSNGYDLSGPAEIWTEEAISVDDEFVEAFGTLARELDMAVGVTLLEKWSTGPRNTLVLFDRRGERKMVYAKVHTCDFDVERALTPGDGFEVVDLDTGMGTVKVGAMICYDREFPESARLLMLNGAEILLVPNACELNPARLGQLSARAFENMVGVATANYPGDGFGRSAAFSPVVFDKDGGYVDNTVALAGEEETLLLADFDLEAIRSYRRREVWGNAYRRPESYGALTETTVKEPFAGRPRFKK